MNSELFADLSPQQAQRLDRLAERCSAARFEASALRELMSADPELGNLVRARALSVVSRRLDELAEAVLAQRAVMASQAAAPAYA